MLLLRIFWTKNKRSKLNTKNCPMTVGRSKRGSSLLNRLKTKCAGNKRLKLLLTKNRLKMCTNRKEKKSKNKYSAKKRNDGTNTSKSNLTLTSEAEVFVSSTK